MSNRLVVRSRKTDFDENFAARRASKTIRMKRILPDADEPTDDRVFFTKQIQTKIFLTEESVSTYCIRNNAAQKEFENLFHNIYDLRARRKQFFDDEENLTNLEEKPRRKFRFRTPENIERN